MLITDQNTNNKRGKLTMAKLTIYSKERGVRTLKEGITLERYQEKYPLAIKVKRPSVKILEQWNNDGGCEAIDGCWVEPDGTCSHGYNSWLIELGYI